MTNSHCLVIHTKMNRRYRQSFFMLKFIVSPFTILSNLLLKIGKISIFGILLKTFLGGKTPQPNHIGHKLVTYTKTKSTIPLDFLCTNFTYQNFEQLEI